MTSFLSSGDFDDARPPVCHEHLDDIAVRDFLNGEYTGIGPRRNVPPAPVEPLGSTDDYQPDERSGYAIALYDGSSRVSRVVAQFGSLLSAEEFAIASSMLSYDVVPATRVVPRSG